MAKKSTSTKKAAKKVAKKAAQKVAPKKTRNVRSTGREKILALRVTEEQERVISKVPKAHAANLYEIACRTYNESFENLIDQVSSVMEGQEPVTNLRLDSFRYCAAELGATVARAYLKIQTEVEKETGVTFPVATLASIADNAIDPEHLHSLVLSLVDEAKKKSRKKPVLKNAEQLVSGFRKSNRKLCNELAELSHEDLLDRLLTELAEKQHRREADLERVHQAVGECPNILRVLKDDPGSHSS